MSSWRQLVEAWDDDVYDGSNTHKAQYPQKISVEPNFADIANNADTHSDTSSHFPEDRVHGLSVQQLRAEAGDDWPDIVGDQSQFEAFAQTLLITRMRERGEVPSHYTATTECKFCGIVPIFEGCPHKVEGCPWCFNRVSGRPMPLSVGIDSAAYIYGESENE